MKTKMQQKLHYLRKKCRYNPKRPQDTSDRLPSRDIGSFHHNKPSQFGPAPNHGDGK